MLITNRSSLVVSTSFRATILDVRLLASRRVTWSTCFFFLEWQIFG
uniref:Uncharacterized protein n=1 Tax=Rhizophora mucronata TaxID=61149 RepID=A0A2P2PS14_RHIMU